MAQRIEMVNEPFCARCFRALVSAWLNPVDLCDAGWLLSGSR